MRLKRVIKAISFLLFIAIFSPCLRVAGSNQAPVASFTYSPVDPYAQETITFDASASYDPDGTVVSYQWDFGDGNVATLSTPVITHDYLDCENYIATLTVTDNGGLTSFTSQTIAVINPAHLHLWADVGSYVGSHPDDWIEESWVVSSDVPAGGSLSFNLYIYNKDKDPTYDVYLAVAVDNPLQVASITIGPTTFTPPFDYGEVAWPDVAGGGELPRHGVYPTWHVLAPFGNIDSNYGYYDYPYGPYYAYQAYTSVTITTSPTMNAGFKVHFDAQGVLVKGSTESKDRNNNPYSHDLTFEGSLYIPPQADLSIMKSGPEYAHVGDEITYEFTVANAGPDKAENVVVADSLLGDIYEPKDFAAGVSETFTVKHIVKATDPDPLVNTATVTSDTQDPNLTNNEARWSVDILHPDIEVSKSGPSSAHEGDNIIYTITVANTGGSPLSSVSVTDSILGTIYSGDLAVGQILTFNKPYVVPVGEVDPIVNTITGSGTDDLGQAVSDSTSWSVDILHPAIKVWKSGPLYAHESDAISYTITVENTGDCSLSSVSVTDSILGTIYSGDLAVGQILTFNKPYVVPVGEVDPIANTVTASGEDDLALSVTDSASWSVDVLHPAMKVTKAADKDKAGAGENIMYTIVVENAGDCILYIVEVTDTLLRRIWTSSILDVGESKTLTPIYTVKAGDTDPLVNTVTVCGKDILGLEVMDQDTAEVGLIAPVQCTVTFYTDPSGLGSILFDSVTYTHGQHATFLFGSSYSAAANPPAGYSFDHWEYTGNLVLSSTTTQTITVTVECGGDLKAVFTPTPPPQRNLKAVSQSATPSSVIQGDTVTVEVKVKNTGTTTETFDVKLEYDSTLLHTWTGITLGPGAQTDLAWDWITSSVPSGAYSITVVVDPTDAIAETDETDNICTVHTAVTIESPPAPPPAPPVGGKWVPINKFELLAPWIGLVSASLIMVATISVLYVKHRKKEQD